MATKVRCPECNQRLVLNRASTGSVLIRCGQCKAKLNVEFDKHGVLFSLTLENLDEVPSVSDEQINSRQATSSAVNKVPAAKASSPTIKKLVPNADRQRGASAAPPPSVTRANSPIADKIWAQFSQPHFSCEAFDADTQQHLLRRLRRYLDEGRWDPELLYLGGRYAAAQGRTRDACRFLDPLDQILTDGENTDGENLAPAFFPVGLLYLQVLPAGHEKRDVILQKLKRLAADSTSLARALHLAGYGSNVESLSESPESLLIRFGETINKNGHQLWQPRKDHDSRGGQTGDLNIPRLASEAKKYYEEQQLSKARIALEELLLIDGDQPNALRNLITIVSEQEDIDAYERYWRRYVKVQLWRIMRADEARASQDELIRFYLKVAATTDREFNDQSSKTSERLKTPGLLARWLEAHAALIWLDGLRQVDAGDARTSGRHEPNAHQSLMDFWYRVFYPEFSRYLHPHSAGSNAETPAPIRTQLPFDPALRLLERMVRWSQFGYYLGDHDDAYIETLIALSGFAARIPVQPYLIKLKDQFAGDDRQTKFQRAFQEACSIPFYKLIKADDWSALSRCDSGSEHVLTPNARMWLAYALCEEKQHQRGLEVACRALPDMSAEELGEKTTVNLFSTVVNLNVEEFLPEDGPVPEAEFSKFIETVKKVPPLKAAPQFIDSMLEPVYFAKTRRDVEIYIKDGQLARARQAVEALPATTERAKELKRDFAGQIAEIEEQERTHKLLDETLERVKKLVEKKNYTQARQQLLKLPTNIEEIRQIRESWLSQVAEIVEQEKSRRALDDTLERVKQLVEKQDYAQARQELKALPTDVEEIRQIRESWLSQVAEIEEQAKSRKLLDETMERVQKLVENKKYTQARQELKKLPTDIEEVRQIRENWLSQIGEIEERNKLDVEIDKTIKRVKECIALNDFPSARKAVQRLPNVEYTSKLKADLLTQLNEVEQDARKGATLKKLVDDAFNQVQACMKRGDLPGALAAINSLPDTDPEVREIKAKWRDDLGQIARRAGIDISRLSGDRYLGGGRLGDRTRGNPLYDRFPDCKYCFKPIPEFVSRCPYCSRLVK